MKTLGENLGKTQGDSLGESLGGKPKEKVRGESLRKRNSQGEKPWRKTLGIV